MTWDAVTIEYCLGCFMLGFSLAVVIEEVVWQRILRRSLRRCECGGKHEGS